MSHLDNTICKCIEQTLDNVLEDVFAPGTRYSVRVFREQPGFLRGSKVTLLVSIATNEENAKTRRESFTITDSDVFDEFGRSSIRPIIERVTSWYRQMNQYAPCGWDANGAPTAEHA